MNMLPPSEFAGQPAYVRFRELGAGRIDIEKIFDAFSGHPPSLICIDAKLSGLRERGFADPVKMIASSPAILGYAFDNIDAKLSGLRERGFADPVKMITSLPAILGYAFDNIDAKLSGLRERGFADPVKMIASSPAILGYAFDNIDAKLSYARHMHVDGRALVTKWPVILGYSLKRIHFVARVTLTVSGDIALFCALLTKEPAATAAAASDSDVTDVPTFRHRLAELKSEHAKNIAVLNFSSHRIARAYRRYRGLPEQRRFAA